MSRKGSACTKQRGQQAVDEAQSHSVCIGAEQGEVSEFLLEIIMLFRWSGSVFGGELELNNGKEISLGISKDRRYKCFLTDRR